MNDAPDNPQRDPSAASQGDDVAVDDLLRAAMQARPEPASIPDLAAKAMARAGRTDNARQADRARRLARQRRWGQIASIAAVLLIVAMITVAARRMWERGDLTASSSSTSTEVSTDPAASPAANSSEDTSTTPTSTSSTTGTIAVVFVAELLVLGVVLLSMSRRTPAATWGAEAVAGLW